MSVIPILLAAMGASMLLVGCAQTGLSPVTDAQEKAAIERDWIRSGTLKLTTYYPDKETMERAQSIIEEKKIKPADVSEVFYFSMNDGRHVLFVETDQHGGHARYHCIGFSEDGVPAVYWVQFQEGDEIMEIEVIEKANVDQDGVASRGGS